MNKLIWKIRCASYYLVIANLPISQCWYLAGAAQEIEDWHEYTPKETVLSEISYWE